MIFRVFDFDSSWAPGYDRRFQSGADPFPVSADLKSQRLSWNFKVLKWTNNRLANSTKTQEFERVGASWKRSARMISASQTQFNSLCALAGQMPSTSPFWFSAQTEECLELFLSGGRSGESGSTVGGAVSKTASRFRNKGARSANLLSFPSFFLLFLLNLPCFFCSFFIFHPLPFLFAWCVLFQPLFLPTTSFK